MTLTTTTTPRLSPRTSPRSIARKLVSLTTTYAVALEGGTPLISVPSIGSPVAAKLTTATTTTTNCGRPLTSLAGSPSSFGLVPVSSTSTIYRGSLPPAHPTSCSAVPPDSRPPWCCRPGHLPRHSCRILQHPPAKEKRRWRTARRRRHHRRPSWRSLVAPAPKEVRTTARLLSSPDYEGWLQLRDNSHYSRSGNDGSSDDCRSSEPCRSSAPTGPPQQQHAPMW